jgi:putative membrane protein
MMQGWGAGWWLVGAVFMVFCMVMMVRMMGMGHWGHGGDSGHGGTNEAERTLANRLAKGEIDVEEYERLLEALRRTDGTHTHSSPQT